MLGRMLQFAILLVVSWCAMTFTHEIGHIVCGCLSGGLLRSWELRPWHLPYSLFNPDPHPLVTLWGGPVLGVALPAASALIVRRPWAWFVASFCVLANGVYLAAGWASVDRFLDTPQLLEHGASSVAIALYCLLTIPVGYIGFRRQCMTILSRGWAGDTTTPTPFVG